MSKVIGVKEAARLLSCSPHTIYRLVRSGQLPAKRRRGGRGWILDESDVRNCLEEYRPPESPLRTQREARTINAETLRRLKEAGIG